MRRITLPERWPVAAAMGIGTLVLLLGAWAFSPGLTAALGVAFLFAAACLAFVNRVETERVERPTSEIDRVRRAELALADAGDADALARELCRDAIALLDAPAAVVVIEGIGETVRIEAGDTRSHSIHGQDSYLRPLTTDSAASGSMALAARPGLPYSERDARIVDALAERAASTLRRLCVFEAARAEQQTLVDAVAATSDGMFSVASDLKVCSWNPAMEHITGVSAADAIGQPCCAAFRPLDEDGNPLYGSTCPGRTGRQVDVLVQLHSGDGDRAAADSGDGDDGDDDRRWLSCAFSPTPDRGYFAVVRDVTATRQAEGERVEFLATVSHELRTELQPIKGYLQELMSPRRMTVAQRRRIYELMVKETHRLERQVLQLLHVTSLEQPESEVMPEKLDWEATVLDQIETLRSDEPGREFTVNIEPDLPPVLADDQLASQVLANLLSNAVKFSPAGSTIEVDAVRARERVITSVADQGPGIAFADRDRVFDKFTRLGEHHTGSQQGIGLGLYIVRRSVEAMGGTVWVDEADSGGAMFSFSLPTETVEPVRLVRTR